MECSSKAGIEGVGIRYLASAPGSGQYQSTNSGERS